MRPASVPLLPPRLMIVPVILAIAALTFLAYSPALNGGMLWDDDRHITRPEMRSLEGLRLIWTDPTKTEQYYPLAHSAFWAQTMLWGGGEGDRTIGFHIVNIALHLINALLVWIILRGLEAPGAWLAAALFAVHPVQVESVAWITELKNTLSGFFYLLAMLAYLRFDPPHEPDPDLNQHAAEHRQNWRFYALAFGLFVCALLSKTVTATLPPAILVILWWKRGRLSLRRDVVPLIPFFLAAIAMGAVTVHFERHLWGAEGVKFNFSVIERFLIAGQAVWFYLGKLFWPTNLAFFYSRWTIDAHDWRLYLYPLTAAAVLVILWMARKRLGRGPLAAALFFGGTLFPALGFFNLYWQIYTFVTDHMQYLACIGVFALVSAAIIKTLRRFDICGTPAANAGCAALVIGMAFLTWKQCHIYHDMETLWRDTLAKSPDMWMAHDNLGALLSDQKKFDEAIEQYNIALKLNDNSEQAHYNLANALRMKKRLDEAAYHYKRASQIRPDVADPYNNLGSVYAEQGKLNDAAEAFRKALALAAPAESYGAHVNLAGVLDRQGKTDLAIEELTLALRIKPELVTVVNTMGLLLLNQGKPAEAVAHFDLALQFKPDYAEGRANRNWAESLRLQSIRRGGQR